jgi:hypothetical protein
MFWKKEFNKACDWWEYRSKYKGLAIRIYACNEAPASCKAITEVRTVTEQVPLTFGTRVVTKEVVVGWDCGGHKAKGA